MRLAFRYTHPRTGAEVEIRQAVPVSRDLPFGLTLGARLELVCATRSTMQPAATGGPARLQ